jgi:ABC-type multidrug transport system fused ATPase/permease subunit
MLPSRPPPPVGWRDVERVDGGRQSTALGLDTAVSAGGVNLSQGQKQLVALAPALLLRSAVVVLDEATSGIDYAADVTAQVDVR